MAYIANEPRCKTREQIGKNAIIVFAPILDERTWSAVNVAMPVAEGEITTDTKIRDYDTGKDYLVADFPANIPLGHEVSAHAKGQNTGSETQYMIITAELYDPDNILRAVGDHVADRLAPRGKIGTITEHVILDKPGTWTLHVLLEGEVV